MRFVKPIALVVFSVLTIGSMATAHADTADQLELFDFVMEADGYESNGFSHYSELSEGNSARHTINTTAGRKYYVVGVCDNDCKDLDLSLRSSDDDLLDYDYETDDVPMLQFVAHTDKYVIKVDMEDCSTSTCYYRVKGYGN